MLVIQAVLLIYVLGAAFWAIPSLQDAWFSLRDKEYREGVIFLLGALIAAALWPLFAIYKGILYLPELIEKLPAP